jgi:hypothetical protein
LLAERTDSGHGTRSCCSGRACRGLDGDREAGGRLPSQAQTRSVSAGRRSGEFLGAREMAAQPVGEESRRPALRRAAGLRPDQAMRGAIGRGLAESMNPVRLGGFTSRGWLPRALHMSRAAKG